MPQYEGRQVITTGQATACRRIIEKWLTEAGALDLGRLYRPGHEGPYWCYSLEGGPEGWPLILSGVSQLSPVEWPDGVWSEPVNGVTLAFHVA